MKKLVLFLAIIGLLMGNVLSSSVQADPDIASVSQPLSHSGQLWNRLLIPVCWENPSADNASGRFWTQDAVERSWDAVSNINFTGWDNCTPSSQGIRILIADEGPHTNALGVGLDGMENGVVLNFTFNNWEASCQANLEYCIRAIAVHEFGHALGFAHEHNRTDRAMCNAEPQGTNPTYFITTYDQSSIMNYCSPTWNNNGNLSALDVAGIRMIYGPFDNGTPASVRLTGAMNIVDGEDGRNETGTFDINHQFNLTTTNPSDEKIFNYCVGSEVRVALAVRAQLVPGTTKVNLYSQADMYEGKSCNTNDHEDSDNSSVDISTDTDYRVQSTRLTLENYQFFGSNDAATINLQMERVALSEEAARKCTSCKSIADKAIFMNNAVSGCKAYIQGNIAWDQNGKLKYWAESNLHKLCDGTTSKYSPGNCFMYVMREGDKWGRKPEDIVNWQKAVEICASTSNAQSSTACLKNTVATGKSFDQAIQACKIKR
ncbi:Astacin (Peptidase family M12A) [Thiothrix caldifontis]|uniref:Astacin (Peptidase family M12A) n=1 Tax=Thiothrix caldifontis TaxID=525918 RepID=A0A1H3XMJ2_9GAMM|nr:M12 family metallopeptidase [Thiothrix caldifontis]SDZ99758.1 Astacin (Peptidase family M12A) [Thiothrix caldifontis]